MNELLVKDLLPDLEKATDVRQRIREVRKKPAPSQISRDQSVFDAMNRAAWMATAISTTSVGLSTTSVALPAPASLYSIASLTPQQFNQYEQLQNSTFSQMPMPSGGINIRASEPTGILDVLGSWFSK